MHMRELPEQSGSFFLFWRPLAAVRKKNLEKI